MYPKTRMLLLTALFTAATAVGAFLRIPLGSTSITLQFLFAALAGTLLGSKWGALSQGVYVALGLLGLPVFTMGGGPFYVVQPSFGFLLGLIPAAAIMGLVSRRPLGARRTVLACVLGELVLYGVGLPYMYLILHVYLGSDLSLYQLLWAGMVVYLPGDALKITVVTILAPALSRRLSRPLT